MEKEKVKKLLLDVKNGKINIDEALDRLRVLPYEDLGFAKIDTHRELRNGFPEVILCRGKSVADIVRIVSAATADRFFMMTRANGEIYYELKKIRNDVKYFDPAGIITLGKLKRKKSKKKILVMTAGTSDIPVAEEAAVTAEIFGSSVERLYDVGVAGIHRLFQYKEKLFAANVIIVVAGMEGALVSIVSGLVDRPVIAVPTSVGYGASFNGLAALLAMLNSCAPGVTVVNIDNGFGAGYFGGMINNR
ncbi:MAG: nickel pincer cofactor biosynthesis protein LarB [Chloroflexi bacterium]|nr:nickel pincer cofactor biosynthesis protein LarB [Chloroflexota bacterium]